MYYTTSYVFCHDFITLMMSVVDVVCFPEVTKFWCSHCSVEFESRDTADKHIESKECVKNLLCQSCDLLFETVELLEYHDCSKKPR